MKLKDSLRGEPIAVWKWIAGVAAAIVMAPFMMMACGITLVLLSPFAILLAPVIAVTLFTNERPTITRLPPRTLRHRPMLAT